MQEEGRIKLLLDNVDKEYLDIVGDILNNDNFILRKTYHHHENESVFYHSLMVSINSYKYCKKHNLNYHDAAIGGLLHDFYYNDWQLSKVKHHKISEMHGFIHPKEARENALEVFPNLINNRIEDIIVKHMFPLTIKLPKYKESWVITFYDKKCSLSVFKHPSAWPKYLGFKKRVK